MYYIQKVFITENERQKKNKWKKIRTCFFSKSLKWSVVSIELIDNEILIQSSSQSSAFDGSFYLKLHLSIGKENIDGSFNVIVQLNFEVSPIWNINIKNIGKTCVTTLLEHFATLSKRDACVTLHI